MGKKFKIEFGSEANALKYLGSTYPNDAEAMKEHISNALDEHNEALKEGDAAPVCRVDFTMRKNKIMIEYPYGMSEDEFRKVLKKVAKSSKKKRSTGQIGQLGIGILSFFQVGKKCTFYSRKRGTEDTAKVIIKEGSEDAEFERPKKREELDEPGIKIVIEQLRIDPTRLRGPLGVHRLQSVFSRKFNPHLQSGNLEIHVHYPGKHHKVEPTEIDLPRVDMGYETVFIDGDSEKQIDLELYYDPSEKGKVAIRHMGVVVVDDISQLDALGLENSFYASGFITGFIEANFLNPLPARTAFEEGEEWHEFLIKMHDVQKYIEAHVEAIRNRQEEEWREEIRKEALKVTRDIFERDDFRDLELLEGMGQRTPQPQLPPDGLNFIPHTLRIDKGETGKIPLRALVPEAVPDNTPVHFRTDSENISISPTEGSLRKEDADEDGMVKIYVEVTGEEFTDDPVVITADAEVGQAEAYIRVAPKTITRTPLEGHRNNGQGLNYEFREFPDGASVHSRYSGRTVQINTLNPDYQEAADAGEEELLLYTAVLLGKETLAFNDKTGLADQFLERLVSYWYELAREIS